jgi:hypothetical protein
MRHVVKEDKSAIFKSYKSREFPGITAPTALSLAFSVQGVTGPARRYKGIQRLRN